MLRHCLAILNQSLLHLQTDLEKTRGKTEGWREQFVLGTRRREGGKLAERKRKPNRGVKFLFELLPDSFFLISDVAIQAGRHNMQRND